LTHQIENLMSATNIGVVFVDDKLLLKRFTNATTQVVNFIAQDVGRSLEHITHSLVDTDLPTMVLKSLRARQPTSAERVSADGRWWEIRINPMRAAKGRADGAVITFYDISSVKEAEFALIERSNETRIVGDLLGAHAFLFNRSFEFASHQIGWTTAVGQDSDASLGQGWLNAIFEEDRDRIRQELTAAADSKADTIECLFRVNSDEGELSDARHMRMIAALEKLNPEGETGWSAVIFDVESTVQSGQAVRHSEQFLEAVLRANSSPLVYIDRDLTIRYANRHWCEARDLERNETIIARAFDGERAERRVHGTGIELDTEVRSISYVPDRGDGGEIVGVVIQERDVSGLMDELTKITLAETSIGRSFSKSAVPFALISRKTLRPKLVSPAMLDLTGYTALTLSQIDC